MRLVNHRELEPEGIEFLSRDVDCSKTERFADASIETSAERQRAEHVTKSCVTRQHLNQSSQDASQRLRLCRMTLRHFTMLLLITMVHFTPPHNSTHHTQVIAIAPYNESMKLGEPQQTQQARTRLFFRWTQSHHRVSGS